MGSDGLIMRFEGAEKRRQGTAVLEDHGDLIEYFTGHSLHFNPIWIPSGRVQCGIPVKLAPTIKRTGVATG